MMVVRSLSVARMVAMHVARKYGYSPGLVAGKLTQDIDRVYLDGAVPTPKNRAAWGLDTDHINMRALFIWSDTPEGGSFWNEVYTNYNKTYELLKERGYFNDRS